LTLQVLTNNHSCNKLAVDLSIFRTLKTEKWDGVGFFGRSECGVENGNREKRLKLRT